MEFQSDDLEFWLDRQSDYADFVEKSSKRGR